MPTLNDVDMKALMSEVLDAVERATEIKAEWDKATGDEEKAAYGVVHRDFLWKIQQKIGQLWFYVCGCEDLNPFKPKGE